MAKHKYSEGIEDLLDGIINLNKQFPEINRAAIATIAKRAVEIAKENVEKGGDPTEPHSEFTAELTEKLRGGKTKNILNETGALKKSIRITMNTVAMGNIYVEIGSDLIYAAILEYGGNPNGAVGDGQLKGYIPPRPFVRPAIQQAVWEALGNGLDEKIAKACDLSVQKKSWKHLFS